MSTLLEKMRKYLEETSEEDFLKAWEKTAAFDKCDYKIDDFVKDAFPYSFACDSGNESRSNNFGSKNSSSFFILSHK